MSDSYHPDPAINAEVAQDVLEAEKLDVAAGLPPRWRTCPGCGRSHKRGHFGAIGSLAAGRVGSRLLDGRYERAHSGATR